MQETQETRVPPLGQEEYTLEKEMATCSSSPAWETPWTEGPGGLHGVAESDTTQKLSTHVRPISYSIDCHLFAVSSHNRRDGGALWVLFFMVTKIIHVGTTVMI